MSVLSPDLCARYACEQAILALEGASSLLTILGAAINTAADNDDRADWVASISFIVRGLIDAEEFVRDWAREGEEKEPNPEPSGP